MPLFQQKSTKKANSS